MQKVLRRQILSRNSRVKRQRASNVMRNKKDSKDQQRQAVINDRAVALEVRNERRARREDWFMGSLAPNRDYGLKGGLYGTLEGSRLGMPKVPKSKKEKFVNFAVGDRVVVVEGRDQGKIGPVTKVDGNTQCVELEGLNLIDIRYPSWMPASQTNNQKFSAMSAPIPFSNVRLVVPMSDDADPSKPQREVIVQHLHGGKPFKDRPHGSPLPRHTRYVSGMNLRIPWPEAKEKEFTAHEGDTPSMWVEEAEGGTFVPDLGTLPMPREVIDEVINKYSRQRTRHDAEWIRGKVEEDVKLSWEKRRRVLTPQAEFWERKELERRKQANRRKITKETKTLINLAKQLKLEDDGGARVKETIEA